MYKCFEPIRPEIRQRAYDLIVERAEEEKGGPLDLRRGSLMVSLYDDNGYRDNYCPLGVVNYVLGCTHRGSVGCMPADGTIARNFLRQAAGIEINATSASHFINAVDDYKLSSRRKLANAMGATPKPTVRRG